MTDPCNWPRGAPLSCPTGAIHMRFIIFGVLAAAAVLPASAADKRLMTVNDLALLKTVSAPAIDPAGDWVAYSVT